MGSGVLVFFFQWKQNDSRHQSLPSHSRNPHGPGLRLRRTSRRRTRLPGLPSRNASCFRPHPCHFFNEAHYRTLAAWWNLARREPIYVSGPSGSGKTSTAMQFCARLGIPVVSVTARARMDRRELLGHWALQGGETRWIDGPALLAWKHGSSMNSAQHPQTCG